MKEKEYKKARLKLMCGLSEDIINAKGGSNPNKYNAYLSLNNSATDVWKNFDIDKSIVVEDFETDINGLVDHIDDITYEIKRKHMKCTIPHTDGCGIMVGEKTRMIRLPWIKGAMFEFPFDKFIREKCNGVATVIDIYGSEHNILEEDIRYIFTKSQFKMHQFYDSWDEYKKNFKKYGCDACFCKMEEDYVPKARINYQMLGTLISVTDSEVKKLVEKTNKEIESIGNDYQETLRLLGADNGARNKNYFQQAVGIYPELFRDQYSKEVLKQTKKSLVKQGKAGRLRVNGKYFFIAPDLYAFCEYLFCGQQTPVGLLRNGEVSVKEYPNKVELDVLRSPHLYKEHAIRTNIKNEDTEKWFVSNSIYTSCHDLISRILQFDVDGDTALVINDKNIVKIAKRTMENVVPLFYEAKKAKATKINKDNIYEGMIKAYTSGNIGPKSNLITIVHNNEEKNREEAMKVVKWLCMETNYTIDYAKTLYQSVRPPEVDEIIKKHTKYKLPAFFEYAKDKTKSQCEGPNNSTMNRVSSAITDRPIRFSKSLSKFEYRRLLSDMGFELTADSYRVLERYDYWNKRQKLVFNSEENKNTNDDNYAFLKIKSNIIEETGLDVIFIVNSLVMFLYKERPQSTKKLLWSCFGSTLVENLKKNTKTLGKICQVCGKRFEPDKFNINKQMTCSQACSSELNRKKQVERNNNN